MKKDKVLLIVLGFLVIFTIFLSVLKMTGIILWKWWLVTLPLSFPVLAFIIGLIMAGMFYVATFKKHKKMREEFEKNYPINRPKPEPQSPNEPNEPTI